MAALDFPDAPAVGDLYGSAGAAWKWDGTRWGAAPGLTTARGVVFFSEFAPADVNVAAAGGTIPMSSPGSFVAQTGRTYRVTIAFRATRGVSNGGQFQVELTPWAIGGWIRAFTGWGGQSVHRMFIGDGTTKTINSLVCVAGNDPYTMSGTGNTVTVEDITYQADQAGLGTFAQPGPWTDVPLINTWVINPGEPVQVRMNGDRVEWRGRANHPSGATTSPLVIPIGFRPPFHMPFATAAVIPAGPAWTTASIYFQSTGALSFLSAALLGVTFNGVSYSITP